MSPPPPSTPHPANRIIIEAPPPPPQRKNRSPPNPSTRPLPSTISTSPSEAALPRVFCSGAAAAGGSSFVSPTNGISGAIRTGTKPCSRRRRQFTAPHLSAPAVQQTAANLIPARHLRDPALGNLADQPSFSSLDQDRRRPTPVIISIRWYATVQTPLFATMPPSAPTSSPATIIAFATFRTRRPSDDAYGSPVAEASGRRRTPGVVALVLRLFLDDDFEVRRTAFSVILTPGTPPAWYRLMSMLAFLRACAKIVGRLQAHPSVQRRRQKPCPGRIAISGAIPAGSRSGHSRVCRVTPRT